MDGGELGNTANHDRMIPVGAPQVLPWLCRRVNMTASSAARPSTLLVLLTAAACHATGATPDDETGSERGGDPPPAAVPDTCSDYALGCDALRRGAGTLAEPAGVQEAQG